jgi:hypothetical protein
MTIGNNSSYDTENLRDSSSRACMRDRTGIPSRRKDNVRGGTLAKLAPGDRRENGFPTPEKE